VYNTDKERNVVIKTTNGDPCELSLPELKQLAKEHNIKGISYMSKLELIELLKNHKVLPDNYYIGRRRNKNVKVNDESKPKDTTQKVKSPPRKVQLTLIDKQTLQPTNESITFPSLYKASKYMGTYSCSITNFNGCTYKSNIDDNIYRIDILE
jgi:hypothetical protein